MSDQIINQKISTEEIEKARCEMAGLFRLLARFNLNEGIDNHCSCILSDDTILINAWGVHWTQMTRGDILRFDKSAKVLEGAGHIEKSALMIHEAVHRLCPQATAVAHTHMPYATAITCLDNGRLEPISQLALQFWGRTAYVDEYKGLVHDPNEGERLAKNIGDNIVVFLANHGVITVGNTVGEAFNDMYFLEKAAQVQILAQSTGQPFREIPETVLEHTKGQMRLINEDKETHFQTMLKILDKTDPDYKN
jgi:ribulose-5-phosphate 4-epimerase/fuculose-1-phosphate aldolase